MGAAQMVQIRDTEAHTKIVHTVVVTCKNVGRNIANRMVYVCVVRVNFSVFNLNVFFVDQKFIILVAGYL